MNAMEEWIILGPDLKYGRYFIPLSDYSLQHPYSRKCIPSCLSKLDFWLYTVYLKAYKQGMRMNDKSRKTEMSAQVTPSSVPGIPWAQILDMVPFYIKESLVLTQNSIIEVFDLVNVLIEISDDQRLKLGDKLVYFPKNSRFVISDKMHFSDLVNDKYSLVLIDPPWPNRSVFRANTYSCLDIYSVYDLKLDRILKDGSLVAIWVSNNPKIQKFVREKYFKSINITLLEEWYWIKVTQSGELVVPFSLEIQRRPFEVLYIGQVNGASDNILKKVIFGVPSKHHSRKPFIHDLLSSHPKCPIGLKLECFARNLYPGWTSWGNETLMFNDFDYLETLE